MILDLIFGGGSWVDTLISVALTLPMFALALAMHEAAHGYAAYKCGDMTAYHMGRLTLNPLKHLDPIGFLCLMLFGYGWAKPVPVNARNFRDPKKGMAITGAAGPLANLLLGSACSLFYGIGESSLLLLSQRAAPPAYLNNIMYWFTLMMLYGALINFTLMFFNLIPLPPFDGSRIFYVFLPPKFYFNVMRYERQIMLVVLIALAAMSRLLHFSPFSFLAQKLIYLIASPVILGMNFFIQLVQF